jgi:tRNA (adenine37-N6)-methyltransferase
MELWARVKTGSTCSRGPGALEQLGVQRAHLVLHDWGGAWGMAWAAQHPGRVASLTLINIGVLPGYRWHKYARIWRTPIFGELLMLSATRGIFRALLNAENPKPLARAITERMFDDLDAGARRALLRLYRSAPDFGALTLGLGEQLSALRLPALVVWGKEDRNVPVRYAEQQRKFLRHVRVHELEGILVEALTVRIDTVFALIDRINPNELFVRGTFEEPIMTQKRIELEVLALVVNDRKDLVDDDWGGVISEIKFDDQLVSSESLDGIEEFSHLEIIYFMHRVAVAKVESGARHPRNLTHLPKVGIFAQRPKARPNRLGLARCELLERDALTLRVKGLDAIDGTPVLDVKPYFREFGPRGEVRQPAWTQEIMKRYF